MLRDFEKAYAHTASLHSKAHLTLVQLRKWVQWWVQVSFLQGPANDQSPAEAKASKRKHM